jgi:hypothetical protein
MFNKIIATIICFVTFQTSSIAQKEVQLMEMYKDEPAIITYHNEDIHFQYENGKLQALLTVTQEKLIIDPQRESYFNTESIYHNSFWKLINYEAGTFIKNGNKYKFSPTSTSKNVSTISGSVFYDDSEKTEVFFSNLSSGNKTFIKYTLLISDIYMLPFFYIKEDIPVVNYTLTVSYPKDVKIIDTFINPDPILHLNKQNKTFKNNYEISFQTSHISAAKYIPYLPSALYQLPYLSIRVAQYIDPLSKKDVAVLGTIDHLATHLYHYIETINKTPNEDINKQVVELCKHALNDEDKARNIFNWVQKNIRYIAYEDSLGGYKPREASYVFNKKFGDCKDMTSLLKTMCIAAGLDARFTWIGTHIMPHKVEATPTPSVFNHMICAVKINNTWLYLDATDNEIPFGKIPEYLQGKQAFIEDQPNKFLLKVIPFSDAQQNVYIDTTFIKINQNDIEGSIKSYYWGYNAWDVRMKMKYTSQKDFEKVMNDQLKRGNNKFKSYNLTIHSDTSDDKSFHIDALYKIENYIHPLDESYMVNMHLVKPYIFNLSNLNNRTLPLYFNAPKTTQLTSLLEIPKGFKVSSLPTIFEKAYGELAKVKIIYTSNDQFVILNCHIEFHKSFIQPKNFSLLNEMVIDLQNAYKQNIIISK